MPGMPKWKFDQTTLDALETDAFKRDQALMKDWFHTSELDWTISGHTSHEANIDYMRDELKESITRLTQG